MTPGAWRARAEICQRDSHTLPQLVRPVDAQRWFNVKPENPTNVIAMSATTTA
jgi:hypothetical protein